MSRFRRAILVVLTLVLVSTAVRLGFWQLDRLATRRAANAQLVGARAQPPIDLAGTDPVPGRRATASGRFEAEGELLLRNRVHRAAPGVHVVTPFRVEGRTGVLWILRGFVPAADGVRPEAIPAPTPGIVHVEGEVHALPVTNNGGQPVMIAGDTTWRRLDSAVAQARRRDAAPMVLYLEGGTSGPGQLAAVEPPVLDDGPHLSYALQWFAIALAIAVFGVYALRKPTGRGRVPPAAAP
jgi:surfeit locus 1 family protein